MKIVVVARTASEATSEAPTTAEPASTGQLHKYLNSRHAQLIAVGRSIGAGLFVGSGVSS